MTKIVMATEMAMVTDSNDNNIDANANDCASTTVTRMTGPSALSGSNYLRE